MANLVPLTDITGGQQSPPSGLIGLDEIAPPKAPAPPAPQITGIARAAALPASGFAEGIMQALAPFAASSIDPSGTGMGVTPEQADLAAKLPAAFQNIGEGTAYNRPDLTPTGPIEKGVVSAARGAGRTIPITALMGPAALLPGAATGAVGGVAGDVAETTFPDHPILAQTLGNIAGSAGASGLAAIARGAARLATPVIEASARAVSPGALETQATQRMASAMQQDIDSGSVTAADFAAAHAKGLQPWELENAENTRALAGAITRSGGPARTTMRQYVRSEDMMAGPRVQGAFAEGLGQGDLQGSVEALDAARKAAAPPAYQAAYAAPPVNPDSVAPGGSISSLLARPSGQKAMSKALNIAAEEGRDPASLGIDLAPDGSAKFTGVPSWQTLDYVKRGMDDVIEGMRDPTTGRLVLDTQGRAAQGTRTALRAALRDENPAMGAAWDAWGGPTQSLSAINNGRNALNLTGAEIKGQLADLSPGDQQLYRLSAMQQAVAPKITGGSLGSNEAARVLANTPEQLKPQLEALFPDEASRNNALAAAQRANLKFQAKNAISGNSLTAERLMDQGKELSGAGTHLGHVAGAVSGFAAGEPVVGASYLARLMADIAHKRMSVSPELNARLAQMLTTQNPADLSSTFSQLKPPGGFVPPSMTLPRLGAQNAVVPLSTMQRPPNQ